MADEKMSDEKVPLNDEKNGVDLLSIRVSTGEIIKAVVGIGPVIALMVGLAWSMSARFTQIEKNQDGLKDQVNEIRLQLSKVEANQNKVLFTLHIPQDPPSGFYIWPSIPDAKTTKPSVPGPHSLNDPFEAGVGFNQPAPPAGNAQFTGLHSGHTMR